MISCITLLVRVRRIVPWIAISSLFACAQPYYDPALQATVPVSGEALQAEGEVLKAHLRSGDVVIFDRWRLTDSARFISGYGTRYDLWRRPSRGDTVSLALDSVVVFESNSRHKAYTFAQQGLGVFTTVGTIITVACLSDPKGCFGSCPTFYVEGADSGRVRAEGFSSSVARVLEARDVDALGDVGARTREVAIRMRNEAQETHFVRRVNLLAVPRPSTGGVVAIGDTAFHASTTLLAPSRCTARGGDCLSAILTNDRHEFWSKADSTDLAAREVVEVTFPSVPEHAALVLTTRTSLVSTFLFYQMLAYFGTRAGDVLASVERGTREQAEARLGVPRLMGGIEVLTPDSSGGWQTQGTLGEAGPIASDTKALPLGLNPSATPVTIRLRLTRGNWRIDQLALTGLGPRIDALRITPHRVQRYGRNDSAARARLLGDGQHLVTLPGDEYRLSYHLPRPAGELALFLESEGYYYEWMRDEWIAEENASMAAMMLTDPARALRFLAPAYKSRESRMEQLFWSSRFNTRRPNAGR